MLRVGSGACLLSEFLFEICTNNRCTLDLRNALEFLHSDFVAPLNDEHWVSDIRSVPHHTVWRALESSWISLCCD